jgi:mRNA export factor
MAFKCHRDVKVNNEIKVWTINALATHPSYGTIVTGGSDGTYNFWDKEARTRLKAYPAVGGSISALSYNKTGDILAYAISYDWHKGYASNNTSYPNKVMLHPADGDEAKPKALLKGRT